MMEISGEDVPDLVKTCHACLSTDSDIIDLTEPSNNYDQFCRIYRDCTSLEPRQFKTFSLCQSCLQRLQDFHTFRAMCLASHATIETLVTKNERIANNNCPQIKVEAVAVIEEQEDEEVPFNYECNICTQVFMDLTSLNRHNGVMHGIMDYRCPICHETFDNTGSLNAHAKRHKLDFDNDEGKIYGCGRCEKSYTTPVNLQVHLYSHLGIRPYKCQFCIKDFTKPSALKDHLNVHAGVRNYLCSECGKKFSSALLLKRHQTSHLGTRPFQCNLCPSSFTVTRDLTIHMRIHTGERPYLCPICGRSFRRASHLNGHLRTHTGEKPHVCRFCSKRFAQSSDWKAHERIHTGERPYSCSLCGKKFNQSSGLHSHMKVHGKVKVKEEIKIEAE